MVGCHRRFTPGRPSQVQSVHPRVTGEYHVHQVPDRPRLQEPIDLLSNRHPSPPQTWDATPTGRSARPNVTQLGTQFVRASFGALVDLKAGLRIHKLLPFLLTSTHPEDLAAELDRSRDETGHADDVRHQLPHVP